MSDTRSVFPIAGVLAALVAEKGWRNRLGMHEVFLFWDKVVGDSVAAHAQPNLIRGKVLWVSVSDSVWMQQLHLQKMTFLNKINERLAGDKLADIRFDLALDGALAGRPAAEPKKAGKRPDGQAQMEFETILASLDDEAMKETIRRVWLKFHGVSERSEP